MFSSLEEVIRSIYGKAGPIALHEPDLGAHEIASLTSCINSGFVSSVGEQINTFERKIAEFTGAKHAIATTNGTTAIHVALKLVGVEENDEVLTQSLTFVGTVNPITYCGAKPVFIDVNRDKLSMCPDALESFLQQHAEVRGDGCWNRLSNRRIQACMPMHTYGFLADIERIVAICNEYRIQVVEDAAEALGSFSHHKHAGTFGQIGILSFNGNKVMTTGGGGMLLTDSDELATTAKHITTTGKVREGWDFGHDMVAYNYRLPNLNAALGLAQLDKLNDILDSKRAIAGQYLEWANANQQTVIAETAHTQANYWLNTIICDSRQHRDDLLEYTNAREIMTRPAWVPIHKLSIYQDCQAVNLSNTDWLADRIVNLPSSSRLQG